MSTLLIFMLLAGEAPEAQAREPSVEQPTAIMDVTDDPGRAQERNGVRWQEWVRGPGVKWFKCGARGVACDEFSLVVRNRSSSTLRCRGAIRYPQPNPDGMTDTERTIIVPVGKTWTVVRADAPIDAKDVVREADCTAEPPLPPSSKPAECKSTITHSVDLANYYTKAAQDAQQEGPVFLEFTLGASPANPTDIKVLQTSLYPEIDAAAVRMFGDIQMTTNCVGQRFRSMAVFRLD